MFPEGVCLHIKEGVLVGRIAPVFYYPPSESCKQYDMITSFIYDQSLLISPFFITARSLHGLCDGFLKQLLECEESLESFSCGAERYKWPELGN